MSRHKRRHRDDSSSEVESKRSHKDSHGEGHKSKKNGISHGKREVVSEKKKDVYERRKEDVSKKKDFYEKRREDSYESEEDGLKESKDASRRKKNERREDHFDKRREVNSERRREDDSERRREDDSERRREDDSERRKEDDSERRREDDSERRREDDSERRREDKSERRREDDSERRKEDNSERRKGDNSKRRKEEYSEKRKDYSERRKENNFEKVSEKNRKDISERRREHLSEKESKSFSERRREDFSERERKDVFNRREDIFERRREDGYENMERSQDNIRDKPVDEPPLTSSIDMPASKTKIVTINMKTGGAYIPPARLKMMQEQIKDKGSLEYQKLAWEALKKSLTGLTNKINVSNLPDVVRELFKENLIRGKGVLARSIIQAQAASHTFTPVYAAFVAIINSKFPQIGELILKRLVLQFRRGFRRNDKNAALSAARFIAHLLNQKVAHEISVLEMLILLLEKPTYDSVEIAVAILKESGQRLTELSPKGTNIVVERLRKILHEGCVDLRVQYMIEVMLAVTKDKYKDHPAIPEGLDLVEDEEKITHLITLDEKIEGEEILNVFKFDPEYIENEERYKAISRELLEGENGESSSGSDDEDGDESEAENDEEQSKGDGGQILDMTETNLVALRRTIYLTIQSSLDFEECAHKLLKLELNPGQIVEMCYMILDCCSQQRTYEKFFGLLAQRFCQLNKAYVEPFTDIFKNSYDTIHRVETNKLRNVAKFFSHLLYTDAISWMVLANIKLNEDDTSSSSRIFIKILFQELCEYMSLKKLNDRIKDVTLQEAFDGLFPRNNPRDTRFAINFFTSIGLGGLTDDLREHLKNAPKVQPVTETFPVNDGSASSKAETSSEDTSSSSSSSSDSESSDDSAVRRRRKKKTKKKAEVSSSKKEKSALKDKEKYKQQKKATKHKRHRTSSRV